MEGYLIIFFVYSFCGWFLESVGGILNVKKFVNRGFLIGPYCPVYGVGVLLITICLYKYMDDLIVLYFMSVLICGVLEYLTIIDIEDSKYELSGIYVFDPSSDSIPKEMYKSDAIRKVNYNFFGLTLNQITNTKEEDKLLGVLNLLNGDSLEYFSRKIDSKEKKNLEESFGYDYKKIFERVKNTKKFKEDKLLEFLISTIHKEDFLGLNRNISDLLSNNYILRKKELFKEEKAIELDMISIHDI
jgi:hypothetical protein